VVASLVAGTYGVNFVLGPLNLGVLELVWGVLLVLGGVGGLLVSAAVLASAIPAVLATAGAAAGDETSAADGDPVETLKRRYAAGEVGDEEFERRLDRLLRADDGHDDRTGADEPTTDRSRECEPAYDR
jgi:uncharacterized membrane protein